MAQKKSYSRYFIILQEDEKGYSLASDKVASGYAKLELKNDKCKVSYYVQNLKKEVTPYYMVLICNKKDVKKIIKIGEMNIDDYGRADICYEYPASNVAGSDIAMDKVSGAAIVKILNGNIIPIMSGFASTEIPQWKSFDLVEDKTRNVDEEEKLVNEEPVEEKSIFDKYEESIEYAKEQERKTVDIPKEEDDLQEIKSAVIKDENVSNDLEKDEVADNLRVSEENEISEPAQEGEQVQESVPLTSEGESIREIEKSKDNKEVEESTKESTDIEEEQYRNHKEEYPRGETAHFFRRLVYNFKELPDICREIKRCRWYKVPVNCKEDMESMSDRDKYRIIYRPMQSYYKYIKKYGHCLIGYKCNKLGEVKYLIYGIPGLKDVKEQPYGGKSGFVTWVPMDKDEMFGYWLLFYDFKTSTILIPVKK